MQPQFRVFIASCSGDEAFCARELRALASRATNGRPVLVDQPENADVILVVDIDEAGLFAALRHQLIWRRWPEKSFGLYEGDNPPRLLHGLYSAARKSWSRSGRFLSCAYPLHQAYFGSSVPPSAEVRETPKDLLFSFSGRNSHRLRDRLFRLDLPKDEVVVEDTSAYNHFVTQGADRRAVQQQYWRLAARSKYVLCPRGAGTSSMRLFEMLEAGIAPVVISDDWVPAHGPRWDEIALFVSERDISHIYPIVKAHEGEFIERGQNARQAYEKFFAPDRYWQFIFASIDHIRRTQRLPERLYTVAIPCLVAQEWARQRAIRATMAMKGLLNRLLCGSTPPRSTT